MTIELIYTKACFGAISRTAHGSLATTGAGPGLDATAMATSEQPIGAAIPSSDSLVRREDWKRRIQPGAIVSTATGFFLFRGRSAADGQTTDFVPVTPR